MKKLLLVILTVSALISAIGCDNRMNGNNLGRMLDNLYYEKLLKNFLLLQTAPTPQPPIVDNERSFNFTEAVLGSDENLYFSDDDANVIKKWDLPTGTISIVATLEDSAHALILSEDRSKIYIADGKRIIEYDSSSGTLTQKYNSPAYIKYMYPAGNNIIVCHGAYRSTGYLNRLVRLSDFSELDFKDAVDPSRSSAYSPLSNRVYLISEYSGSFYVSYQNIDLAGGTLGSYSSIIGYNTSHTGNPIKIFPDQSRLAIGTGRVVVIDDTSKNENLGYDYVDLTFGPDGAIYLLHNLTEPDFGVRCRLIKLEGSEPYNMISVSQEYTLTGKRIIRDNDRLIVVTQDTIGSNEININILPFSEL